MLNERLAAALPIAASIKSAEASLNDSVRHIGTLLVNIADAKSAKGTRFAPELGISACESVAQAGVSAIQSFKHMVAAHEHLAHDREQVSLPPAAFGDYACEGKQQSSKDQGTPLRVVGG